MQACVSTSGCLDVCVLVNTLKSEGNIVRVKYQYNTFERKKTVSVLGQEEGFTVKKTPLHEGESEGEARGNS